MMTNFTAGSPRKLNLELIPLDGPAQDGAAATSRPEPRPERAPRAAAAAQGRLRVLTHPPGVAISVDGSATDYRTPVNMPITAGRHKITLEHRGVAPVTREVVISPNQMFTLTVMLGEAGQSPRRRSPFQR